VRFEEILDSYLVEPPAGSGEGKPVPLASLVPAAEAPTFGDLPDLDGGMDCERIYQIAGVPSEAPLTAEKALELIQRLPEDIPLGNRRVVVRMTMETLGASGRDVLSDAAAKIWALDCYFRAACAGVSEASQDVDQRVADLRRQIEELLETKGRYEARRAKIEASADSTIQGIRKVVEFFAIPKVQNRSEPQPATAAGPDSPQLRPESPSPPESEPAADPPATATNPSAAEGSHYDPIRRPLPEDDELELSDPPTAGEKSSGFWQASKSHRSPDTAEELAGSFYTESGEIRRPNRKTA
jgi:hypothetical protein